MSRYVTTSCSGCPEPTQITWCDDEVEFHEDYPCVEMPCCGFVMGAEHTDAFVSAGEVGVYTCPICESSQSHETIICEGYRRALEYIANTNPSPRPDGTYNVSREALIQRAKRALGE